MTRITLYGLRFKLDHRPRNRGVKQKKVFVNGFKEPLASPLSAYPEAKVETADTGLILHPSDSPVPKTPIRVASFRNSGGLALIGGASD